METITDKIKKYLSDSGADIIGIGDLSEIDSSIRKGMQYGISIAVAIPPSIIQGIEKAPTPDYFNTYHELNAKLDFLVTNGAGYLCDCGYEAYAQTVSAVAEHETEYGTVLPHKTIATRAGIGWIGKSALLVTKDFGSAIRISSILTNAPLKPDTPVNESLCSDCMICMKACPAKAVNGINWRVTTPRDEILNPVKCRQTARAIAKKSIDKEITLCGKCIYICPYTQKYILNEKKRIYK